MTNRPWAVRWSGILLIWLFCGSVLSVELYFSMERGSGNWPRRYLDWADIVIPQFGRAAMWALLAPFILQLRKKLPPLRIGALVFHFFASFVVMATFYLGRLFSYNLFAGESLEGFWSMAASMFYGRNIVDMAYYWAMLGFGQGLEYHQKYRNEELRTAQLEAKLIETELKALKQQLNPHFLFNTMNTISVLVREHRNDEAVQLIARLSSLLRMTLENTRVHTVTLRQELDFLMRYLEIQRTRFGDKLHFRTEVEAAAYDAIIPNLILQPAVENAIVHGIAQKTTAGTVAITARVRDQRLELEVKDDGPGCEISANMPLKSGIGLSNTRVRLERHYGAGYQMVLRSERGRGVTVSIMLPFLPAEAASP